MSDSRLPIESYRVDVLDSSIHYLACGNEGDPILFLHGVPCSSYLWRPVLPTLARQGRCIAPDLMGMGQSGFPGVPYVMIDHIRYIESLIEVIKLENITLVVHGWGSVVGLDIASRMPNRFKRLVFCESHLRPIECFDDLSLLAQELVSEFGTKEQVRKRVVQENCLLEEWLPAYSMKKLTQEDIDAYQAPYKNPISREVLLQYAREFPKGTGKDEITRIIANYSSWLKETILPKLLVYGMPGFMTTVATVDWAQQNFKNLTVAEVPDTLHFIPQSSPRVFELAVNDWLLEN